MLLGDYCQLARQWVRRQVDSDLKHSYRARFTAVVYDVTRLFLTKYFQPQQDVTSTTYLKRDQTELGYDRRGRSEGVAGLILQYTAGVESWFRDGQ